MKFHFQNEIGQLNDKAEETKGENAEHVQYLTEVLNSKALTIEELNGQIDALREVKPFERKNFRGETFFSFVRPQEISAFSDEKRAHERKGAALVCATLRNLRNACLSSFR